MKNDTKTPIKDLFSIFTLDMKLFVLILKSKKSGENLTRPPLVHWLHSKFWNHSKMFSFNSGVPGVPPP